MVRVTEVINAFNPTADFMNNKQALERGAAVHRATELYDKDMLDIDSLDPIIIPYFEAYKKFLAYYKPKYLHIENRLKNMFMTGKPDRYGIIKNHRCLVSIKTGGFQIGYCGLQESAYANLLGWELRYAYIVILNPDGYKVHRFKKAELKQYYSVFLSFLNTYKFIDNGFKI